MGVLGFPNSGRRTAGGPAYLLLRVGRLGFQNSGRGVSEGPALPPGTVVGRNVQIRGAVVDGTRAYLLRGVVRVGLELSAGRGVCL